MNLLSHPAFVGGVVDTGFIARNPDLLQPVRSSNRCVTTRLCVLVTAAPSEWADLLC